MSKTMFVIVIALVVWIATPNAVAAEQILSGPLAKLDIKAAVIEKGGVSKGTLTTAQHFGLSPKWTRPPRADCGLDAAALRVHRSRCPDQDDATGPVYLQPGRAC